jgi:Leucine-rich repeat (LRR) protein
MKYELTQKNINEPIPIETTILKCRKINYLPENIASANGCFGNLINLKKLDCSNNQLEQFPKTPVTSVAGHKTPVTLKESPVSTCASVAGHKTPVGTCSTCSTCNTCESMGNLNNLKKLFCKSNPFNDNFQNIILKYGYTKAQNFYKHSEMLI